MSKVNRYPTLSNLWRDWVFGHFSNNQQFSILDPILIWKRREGQHEANGTDPSSIRPQEPKKSISRLFISRHTWTTYGWIFGVYRGPIQLELVLFAPIWNRPGRVNTFFFVFEKSVSIVALQRPMQFSQKEKNFDSRTRHSRTIWRSWAQSMRLFKEIVFKFTPLTEKWHRVNEKLHLSDWMVELIALVRVKQAASGSSRQSGCIFF